MVAVPLFLSISQLVFIQVFIASILLTDIKVYLTLLIYCFDYGHGHFAVNIDRPIVDDGFDCLECILLLRSYEYTRLFKHHYMIYIGSFSSEKMILINKTKSITSGLFNTKLIIGLSSIFNLSSKIINLVV